MSTDMKLVKTQISKIVQSGQSFDCWIANLGKKKKSTKILLFI